MIKAGLLCGGCQRSCKNKPSSLEPLMIACPNCDEQGCSECNQEGFFCVSDCPKSGIDLEFYQITKLADWLQNGLPPVSGGALNQAAWFMDFAKLLKSEITMAENEYIRGGAK